MADETPGGLSGDETPYPPMSAASTRREGPGHEIARSKGRRAREGTMFENVEILVSLEGTITVAVPSDRGVWFEIESVLPGDEFAPQE